MSRHRLQHRRLLAATAATGLALAGLALTVSPASAAAPWAGTLGKGTAYNNTGAGCTQANTGISPTPVAMPANSPVAFAVSDSSTGTGPTAPDTSAMNASATGTALINETAAGVTGFDVTASMTANASRALGAGSACSTQANSILALSGTFSTSTAGLLDVDFSNLGTGFGQHQVQIFRIAPGAPSGALTISAGEQGRTHRLVAVQPGDYVIAVNLIVSASSTNSASAPGPAANLKVKVHGDFKPFGVADGAASGSASKYVTLGDSVTCASHSVTADFTNKAGKKPKKGKKPVITKAKFFVDGVKVKSAKKPNKKTLVTLTGIPDDVVTVSAELKLTGKGKVTVQRTYLPCS